MSSTFTPRLIKYSLRTQSDFLRKFVNIGKSGLNSIGFFALKVWQMVPVEMKNLRSLKDFKNKIRRWEPDGCDCKLCKEFVSNLGYVNLVWLWDIGLTLEYVNMVWFQVLRNAYHVAIACFESTWGDCRGVWNMCRVNDGGNRVMSMISLWCL